MKRYVPVGVSTTAGSLLWDGTVITGTVATCCDFLAADPCSSGDAHAGVSCSVQHRGRSATNVSRRAQLTAP